MATIRVIHENLARGNLRVHWVTPLTATDTEGQAMNAPMYATKSVAVTGTFDGATVTMQGSIDGTNYVTLHDQQGNNCAFTTAGIKNILENPPFIKPVKTGGSGAESLTVYAECDANHAG